jgi:excisionase family DNA binding protein
MSNEYQGGQRVAYSISELAGMLGLGRSTLYEEIRAGRLRLTKLRGRSIILAEDLAEYLEAVRQCRA